MSKEQKKFGKYFKKGSGSFDLNYISLRSVPRNELLGLSRYLRLSLTLDEMLVIKNYYLRIKRDPTDVELETFAQTWSEHCFHKTFRGIFKTNSGKINNLFKTFIEKATKEINPKWCISVFKDNAGIVEFDEKNAVSFKVETHNHPSAIEPFGGASTGVGGVIRDTLGVWGDPIAGTDVLCFGPLDYDYKKLPKGVKHPSYIFRGVVAGVGAYGNNMGIPTVNGAILFDESYVTNPLVYCGSVGFLPKSAYIKNTRLGDVVLLAGGKTGIDGIHGVTFASASLSGDSEETSRSAVQIGDPIEEEKLRRAILEIRDRRLASSITDLGGGGLSSA
ncbi:MAG: phosphoribosylformylglycinamidine synthase, partial [Planctomycetes bacterium]|nr:phosphoribosylformylglycinamidine synthase [Planctomycetota bacterium]